ncbi:MAG: methylenetetrahydrofolate reductase, partial [Gammaproteobacteria bacterium]
MTVNPIIRRNLGSPWNQSFEFHDRVLQPISIEVLPKLNFDSTGLSRLLPVGTRIFIPHLPKTTLEEIFGTVRGLKLAGFEPVPHIAARRIASPLELKLLLTALHGQEVQELLLVAGGNDTPVGEYKQCMDVLDSEIFEQFRFKRLLFAGHPEGHPSVDGKQIETALSRKIQKATQMGCETAVVTQFCFNIQATSQWIHRLRNTGIDASIYLGITGPVSFKILLRYAAICGVSVSTS